MVEGIVRGINQEGIVDEGKDYNRATKDLAMEHILVTQLQVPGV